jgi:hypothetical protein
VLREAVRLHPCALPSGDANGVALPPDAQLPDADDVDPFLHADANDHDVLPTTVKLRCSGCGKIEPVQDGQDARIIKQRVAAKVLSPVAHLPAPHCRPLHLRTRMPLLARLDVGGLQADVPNDNADQSDQEQSDQVQSDQVKSFVTKKSFHVYIFELL